MSGSAAAIPARNYRPRNPQIRYEGIFKSLDFPDYVYREYPKFIPLEGGGHVIAESLRHELVLKAELMMKIAPTADGDSRHEVEIERDDLQQKLDDAQRDNKMLQERIAEQGQRHTEQMSGMEAQIASLIESQKQMMKMMEKPAPPTKSAASISN